MKKSTLYLGILWVCLGIILPILFLRYDNPAYYGIGGGLIGGGLSSIFRYIYWTRPSKKAEYEKKQKEFRINLHDERKIMLRARSGQITYQIMFFVLVISSFISALLQAPWQFTLTLFLLWLFQWICGTVVFYWLSKKI